jgi:hypothetical protein
MDSALLAAYVANATFLICHEMDSAYWREWRLLGLPGGLGVFLALHLPLWPAVLWGLVLLARGRALGLWFSLGVGLAGLVAFGLHAVLLAKGREEFRHPASLLVLAGCLAASLWQLWLTFRAWPA